MFGILCCKEKQLQRDRRNCFTSVVVDGLIELRQPLHCGRREYLPHGCANTSRGSLDRIKFGLRANRYRQAAPQKLRIIHAAVVNFTSPPGGESAGGGGSLFAPEEPCPDVLPEAPCPGTGLQSVVKQERGAQRWRRGVLQAADRPHGGVPASAR
jgi:hypothetical protein